eukprot:272763_1
MAVWAVDMTLSLLCDLLGDIRIPGGGLVYIVDINSSRVIASSGNITDHDRRMGGVVGGHSHDVHDRPTRSEFLNSNPFLCDGICVGDDIQGYQNVSYSNVIEMPPVSVGGYRVSSHRVDFHNSSEMNLVSVIAFPEDKFLQTIQNCNIWNVVLGILAVFFSALLSYSSFMITPSKRRQREEIIRSSRGLDRPLSLFGIGALGWRGIGRRRIRKLLNVNRAMRRPSNAGVVSRAKTVSVSRPVDSLEGGVSVSRRAVCLRDNTGDIMQISVEAKKSSISNVEVIDFVKPDCISKNVEDINIPVGPPGPVAKVDSLRHCGNKSPVDVNVHVPENLIRNCVPNKGIDVIIPMGSPSPPKRVSVVEPGSPKASSITSIAPSLQRCAKIQSEEEQEMAAFRSNRCWSRSIKTAGVLIGVSIVAIWVIWYLTTSQIVNRFTSNLVEETYLRIDYTLHKYLVNAPNVNIISRNRFLRNSSNLAAPSPEIGVHDRYFVQVLDSLRDDDGSFLVEYVYIGWADGSFNGAKFDSEGRIVVGARDHLTSR